VFPTYHCGNRSRVAVDGETPRSVLEDDGGSFRCSSGSGDSSGDGGVDGGGGSFKRRLDLGGLDSAGRQRKLGRLGLGQNPHREGVIYREKMI
jgi:hypothetical protein